MIVIWNNAVVDYAIYIISIFFVSADYVGVDEFKMIAGHVAVEDTASKIAKTVETSVVADDSVGTKPGFI